MVDIPSLSDNELRTKLSEFGFPVMPITGTTRKVMEKKLKILLENKGKINKESNRRSLARYSSDEDSDMVVKETKKDKNKRTTMAAPTSRVTLRKTVKKVEDDSDSEIRRPLITEEKRVTSGSTKVTTLESGFDTGSDSESEIVQKTYKPALNNHDYKKNFAPTSPSISSTSAFVETTRKYSPPRFGEDVINKPVLHTYTNQSPSRYTSYGSSASDYASDRLNQIRSRLSLGSPSYDRPSFSSNIVKSPEKEDGNLETPFLSNFTKRLSQISNNSMKFDDYQNDFIKEHDTNGSGSVAGRNYSSRFYRQNYPKDYRSGRHVNAMNNWVSFAVIAVALLFFILLAVIYMGLRNGPTAIDVSDLKANYCDRTNPHGQGKNCVMGSEVRDAVKLYDLLKPELLRRAIDNRCIDSDIKPFLTEDEIMTYIERTSTEHMDRFKALRNMEILTLTNPQWEVSLHKVMNGAVDRVSIKGFEELDVARSANDIALAVSDPDLPWTCTLYNKIVAIVEILLILGVGFVVVYSLNMGYKYYKHYRQKQRDNLFYMIERIIDTLQSNASEDGDNYLVINHVRDMILPINDRPRMERTWRNAVNFINNNESRVRTEVQVVQGEPYEVWRWLGSPNLNTSGSPRNKSWQGQAFETQVGSVNSLPCSPTPCLKIRGMVDDGDRNLHTIRDAVLSKCAHECRILHCAVDINSKCVYLKCADQNDAAIAYRSLHGWWYAGNLVTVKYLRLERYMQRYPDSPVSGPLYLKALQPATDWTS